MGSHQCPLTQCVIFLNKFFSNLSIRINMWLDPSPPSELLSYNLETKPKLVLTGGLKSS